MNEKEYAVELATQIIHGCGGDPKRIQEAASVLEMAFMRVIASYQAGVSAAVRRGCEIAHAEIAARTISN